MDINFSTSAVSSRSRLDAWRDVLCQAFGPLETCKTSELDFDGSVRSYQRAQLRFNEISYRGQSLERTPHNLRVVEQEYFTFSQSLAGPLHVSQNRRNFRIEAGSLILANQFVPYKVTAKETYRAFSIWIPREMLLQRQPHLDSFYSLQIDDGSPRAELLTSFARHLAQGMVEWSEQEACTLRDQMLDLIVLMMVNQHGGTPSVSESSVKAAHRERALRVIKQLHRDPGLNPKTVAAACGISLAYLQQIFRAADLQLADLICVQRIETAKSLLCDAGSRDKSEQQIAFEAGFKDVAQFSQVFVEKCRMSPSDFRFLKSDAGGATPGANPGA
ncbi:helix-turn-helix domain-containing protein [soil metagenome]